MITTINLPENYSSSEQVKTLDGIQYIFQASWNSTYGCWWMSLFDIQKRPFFLGKTLRINTEILTIHNYKEGSPQGELLILSANGSDDIIQYEDFWTGKAIIIYNSDNV